jgi:hypothetical protein
MIFRRLLFPTRASIEADPVLSRSLAGAGLDNHGAHEPVPIVESKTPIDDRCIREVLGQKPCKGEAK